jgi:TrwC relaxase
MRSRTSSWTPRGTRWPGWNGTLPTPAPGTIPRAPGEWRDGDGLVAGVFLHHISRDGDPHLHMHIAVWNRVQRADRADEKWRRR